MPNRLSAILLGCLFAISAHSQVNIVTANYGIDRTNANTNESILAPSNVNAVQFGRLGLLPVDGQVYAQPLYASSVAVAGKGTRNVVFVATMNDTLYAFDADSPRSMEPLWSVHFGDPLPASFFSSYTDIQPSIGILGTPAIDLSRNAIYVVSETFENSSAVFRLHALNLADGSEILGGPAVISATAPGNATDGDGSTVAFTASEQLQRPGVLLANSQVYLGFGSHGDQSPYHGWLLSYDASNLQHQMGVFNTTPNGGGGAIWQAGRGPAADQDGNIFVLTGNGDYDGNTLFAESILKFSPSARLLDWFTPSEWEMLSIDDYDLGSTGAALVPGTSIVVGGDKYGTLFLVQNSPMGHLSADNTNVVQSFQGVRWGGIFNFALWGVDGGAIVYLVEQGSYVKAYQLTGGQFNTAPFATGNVIFDIPYNGICVSSNGTDRSTGIVWVTAGDHSVTPAPETLHAFDANTLEELWNSEISPARDRVGLFAKFVAPTVAAGKVFVPTFSNQLMVYGPLDESSRAGGPRIGNVVNAASYLGGTVSPGELVSVWGSQIGPSAREPGQVAESGSYLSKLADTQVLFDGVAAPLLYVSASEIGAVTPFSISNSTQVQVISGNHNSNFLEIPVSGATPAIFTADGSGVGQITALNQDGTVNSTSAPALAGSVVSLFATGAGSLLSQLPDGSAPESSVTLPPASVLAQIGSASATVAYAGSAPGMIAGIIQINVEIPPNTSTGAIPIQIQIGGQSSQPGATIWVQGTAPAPQAASVSKHVVRR